MLQHEWAGSTDRSDTGLTEYRRETTPALCFVVSGVTGHPIPPSPIFPIPDSRTLKFLTLKNPATHLQRLWCFKCPWAAAIAYHQVIRLLVYCVNTMPDPGIEPETPCSAVALATTGPTRHSSK
uniref:SFRICE_016016 n=1 Tax=Spodoptera frugiperda TaxID=7108 RepID=A0A2H1VMV1_SPOFR